MFPYLSLIRALVCTLLLLGCTLLLAQPGTDYRISINDEYSFDPLVSPPDFSARLRARPVTKDSSLWLVQFRRPLTRRDVLLLKETIGLQLNAYVHNLAYKEYLSNAQLSKLRNLPFLRWDGAYEPGFKISPKIGTLKFRTKERMEKSNLLLLAVATDNADSRVVAQLFEASPATNVEIIDERKYGGKLKVKFELANKDDLYLFAREDYIVRIEEVGETFDDNGSSAGTIQSGTPGTTPIWNAGINGENQVIGILDGGRVDIAHCWFTDAVNPVGTNHRKVAGHRGTAAISAHATFVAGIACGDDINNPGTGGNRGMAWAARFTNAGRNSSTILTDLSNARADGASIHTNSWHDEPNPQYNQVAVDVDNFLHINEFDFVCGSSGNVGESIGPPGTAKNAICVSATMQDPNENNFGDGNSGPTPEGRRKPDLFTPGCNITSANSGTTCGTTNWSAACATSWATPALAGTAALVRQYYQEGWYPFGTQQPHIGFTPTGALIKATLLNSTLDMTGIAGYPGNQEGWGQVRLNNVLYLPGNALNLRVWDVLNASGLFTGESITYNYEVSTNTQPLKLTLVWTDPPAASGAATPLINDLDLVVTAPDGTTVYRGNDFTASQSTVNGTNADNANNVEMVLVTNPQPGNYTLRINGTQVNQGPQGFALVATADTADPPSPVGNQNTLVVRASLPGTNPAGAPSLPNALGLIAEVNDYISEVSYGQTTINPADATVTLSNSLGTYLATNNNPLIEMAGDAINQLVADNPDVFDQGTADPTDDIDRIMILLNDQSFTGDWATTGPWPYELPDGLTRPISVSVSSVFNDPGKRLVHAMCHQLGLWDLYNHPGVVFAQPHVDGWDIMANLNEVQPMAWSKERAQWLSTHSPASIRWVPRPAAGASFNQTIPLNWLSSTSTGSPRAIAVGLTPGVANMANENVFYFLEARTRSIGDTDDLIPEDNGVLLYYVNEDIQQGEGTVRIIDQQLTTAADLNGAAFGLGVIPPPGGTGLALEVLAPTGSEAFRIKIDYDPPETTHDINIRKGSPVWTSPDIWVDSQVDGYDEDKSLTPADRGDQPVAGEDNRIYFTVNNPGPGDAFDVTVSVRVSEPYHTIGDAADFNRFVSQKFYAKIDAGTSITDYVVWRPNTGDDPHSCIQVKIEDVFNDINDFNNVAQQNVEEAQSTTASPYDPVTFNFSVTNPYDYHQLFYFRLEGLPQGWTYSFTDAKKRLNALERYEGSLTVTPPDDAEVCTDHELFVTSWLPKGNTLIPFGGSTLKVSLRNRTTINAKTRLERCDPRDGKRNVVSSDNQAVYQASARPQCIRIVTEGCTNPIRANEEIILRYEGPDGEPVYRVVMTDAQGCYSDSYVVTDGGVWTVSSTYEGDDCAGKTTTGRGEVPVPIEPRDNPLKGKKFWISAHVGSTHPLGDLDDAADANVYLAADLTYALRDNMNLVLLGGLAQMTRENTLMSPHPRWLHLSANLELSLPRAMKMKPYLRAGPGYYRDKGGANTTGFNVGLGAKTLVNDELYLTPGLDFHYLGLNQDRSQRFLALHLGILFR